MASSIEFDDSTLQKGLDNLGKIDMRSPVFQVALEILRLSQFEVPHDDGLLQNSGMIDPTMDPNEYLVGYNKVYAARLHEHPEYNFQKGRKGKYLEDPIKRNLNIFQKHIQDGLNSLLS